MQVVGSLVGMIFIKFLNMVVQFVIIRYINFNILKRFLRTNVNLCETVPPFRQMGNILSILIFLFIIV